jgi:hypothetical protein
MGTRLLFIFLIMLLPAFAGRTFGMVIESGNTIIIDHPVTQDLYLAGGTIVINAPVHGDLVVAGGKVYVNDSVTRDILIVGGTIVIKGYVGGKVRCLGGNVTMENLLQGDLLVGGGDVKVEMGCTVMGSVLAGSGRLTLYGEVKEDVRAYSAKLFLYGPIGRNLEFRGGTLSIHGTVGGEAKLSVTEGLEIGDKAVFNGPLRYWCPVAVDFGRSLRRGVAMRDEGLAIHSGHWYFLGGTGALVFLWYLGMALVLIISLQYLFRQAFRRAGEKAHEQTVKSFGTGLLFFLGTPLLIGITIASLIAMPVGFFILFGYILILTTCGSISSLVAAHWFSNLMGSNAKFWEQVGIAFIFFILLRLTFSIPLFGWLLYPIIICIAIGSLALVSFPKQRVKT